MLILTRPAPDPSGLGAGDGPIRRVLPVRWRVLDRIAAVAYGLLALMFLARFTDSAPGMVLAPLAAVAFALPIAVRRDRPLVAFGVLCAASGLCLAIAPTATVFGLLGLAPVLYTIAATRRAATAACGLVVAIAVALATGLPDFQHRGGAVLFSLVYSTVWTMGYAVGLHRGYTARLLRQQASMAERAITEERMRIARELHDVVAHGMSVITVQAGFGGLVIDQHPDQARTALAVIESTGRDMLTEMRRLLGVLRTAKGPEATTEHEPAPRLADLPRLVERTAEAGVRVELTVTGKPRPLPAGIELSAYRIVQEALTNVVKHARTATAGVVVGHRPDGLRLEITDSGAGTGDPAPGGHGLIGIRERVNLYGGTFEAAPRPAGGFRVAAHIPLPDGGP